MFHQSYLNFNINDQYSVSYWLKFFQGPPVATSLGLLTRNSQRKISAKSTILRWKTGSKFTLSIWVTRGLSVTWVTSWSSQLQEVRIMSSWLVLRTLLSITTCEGRDNYVIDEILLFKWFKQRSHYLRENPVFPILHGTSSNMIFEEVMEDTRRSTQDIHRPCSGWLAEGDI